MCQPMWPRPVVAQLTSPKPDDLDSGVAEVLSAARLVGSGGRHRVVAVLSRYHSYFVAGEPHLSGQVVLLVAHVGVEVVDHVDDPHCEVIHSDTAAATRSAS